MDEAPRIICGIFAASILAVVFAIDFIRRLFRGKGAETNSEDTGLENRTPLDIMLTMEDDDD